MASNAEMRRLILHAADQLAGAPADGRMVRAIRAASYDEQAPLMREALAMTAAMALAEATLRMVATCLAGDEPEASTTPTPPRGPGGRFVKGASS